MSCCLNSPSPSVKIMTNGIKANHSSDMVGVVSTDSWCHPTISSSPNQVYNPNCYYPYEYTPPPEYSLQTPPSPYVAETQLFLYQNLPQITHPYNFESHSSQATYVPQLFDGSPKTVSVATAPTPPYVYHQPQTPAYTPQTPPLFSYVQTPTLLYTPPYTLTCHTTLSTEQPYYAIETGADRVKLHQSGDSSDSVSEFPPTPTYVSTHVSTHVTTAPLMFDESPERVRKVVSLPVATGEVMSGNDVIVTSESCDEDDGFGLFTEADESVKKVENGGDEENRDTTAGYEPWNREWDWDDESDVEIETKVENASEGVRRNGDSVIFTSELVLNDVGVGGVSVVAETVAFMGSGDASDGAEGVKGDSENWSVLKEREEDEGITKEKREGNDVGLFASAEYDENDKETDAVWEKMDNKLDLWMKDMRVAREKGEVNGVLVEDADDDVLFGEETVLHWLQALNMQVMGACRANERLNMMLKHNGSNAQLNQHSESAKVLMLAKCLCISHIFIRVGKINKQGTHLCTISTRGNLTPTLLPTSKMWMLFIGNDGQIERLATLSSSSSCSSVKRETLLADKSGRSLVMRFTSCDNYYFYSERSKLLGDELITKLNSLLTKKPSLAQLTGISESRLGCFATRLHSYLGGPLSDNDECAKLLQKISYVLQLLIKHKCLTEGHLSKILKLYVSELQSADSMSQLFNYGVDQTPLCNYFLRAQKLKKVLQFFQELSHSYGVGQQSEKNSFLDDSYSDVHTDTTQKLVFDELNSFLLLDENFMRCKVFSSISHDAFTDYATSAVSASVEEALQSIEDICNGEDFNYIKESFKNGTLHLIGYLSDGVHSRINHVLLLVKGASKRGWDAQVLGVAPYKFKSAFEVVKTLREAPKATDQYLPPFVMDDESGKAVGPIVEGDAVVTFNFRADRMVMAVKTLENEDLDKFDQARVPKIRYAGMLQYDGELKLPSHYLVSPPEIDRRSGSSTEYLTHNGIRTFAYCETVKFGHDTFFWNGNCSGYFDSEMEEYVEVPSDIGITFNIQPKMKALEIQAPEQAALEGNYVIISGGNDPSPGHVAFKMAKDIKTPCYELTYAGEESTLEVLRITSYISNVRRLHDTWEKLDETDEEKQKKVEKKKSKLGSTIDPSPQDSTAVVEPYISVTSTHFLFEHTNVAVLLSRDVGEMGTWYLESWEELTAGFFFFILEDKDVLKKWELSQIAQLGRS